MLADLRPAALLAVMALTAVLADLRPAALLAVMALTAVLADSRPAALLAPIAPLPVGTSAAHLAVRPVLHPVLAWPLRVRGSLPLHALLPRILLLLFALRSLHLGDAGAQPVEVGSPNRRPLPREILGLFVFPMVVRGRFDVDGGGWWWWSSGSSLTTTGSLFNKAWCQMVLMAHGDTSYDDLGSGSSVPRKLTVTVSPEKGLASGAPRKPRQRRAMLKCSTRGERATRPVSSHRAARDHSPWRPLARAHARPAPASPSGSSSRSRSSRLFEARAPMRGAPRRASSSTTTATTTLRGGTPRAGTRSARASSSSPIGTGGTPPTPRRGTRRRWTRRRCGSGSRTPGRRRRRWRARSVGAR